MPDNAYFESKQLYNTIREYTGQIKRINNQLHSLRLLPVPSKDTIKSLEKVIACMQKEIKLLELKLQQLLVQWQPDQLKSVSSVKGIGKRAAVMLIVLPRDLNTPKTTASSLALQVLHLPNTVAEAAYRVNPGYTNEVAKICGMYCICAA